MKTILLVEDDPFLTDIYTTKLKEAGFEVEAAEGGEEALEKIRQNNAQRKTLWPDLMLLDIVLPRIDGWEILKEIKRDDKLKDLKVIILSNLSQKAEIDKGMALGAIKYLIKAHYTPSEVVEEIKKIL
jgi:DNA-binding response OmpR family regulator